VNRPMEFKPISKASSRKYISKTSFKNSFRKIQLTMKFKMNQILLSLSKMILIKVSLYFKFNSFLDLKNID
jgi:hypothetical protein